MTQSEAIYLDTSALLPYYRNENLSEQVQTLLQNSHGAIFISDLTLVEVSSALARLYRTQEIRESDFDLITQEFDSHIKQGFYSLFPMERYHFQQAKQWLNSHKTALRTLDALHLACANSAKSELITADSALHKAAHHFEISSQLLT